MIDCSIMSKLPRLFAKARFNFIAPNFQSWR
jgi:hypothetical protein